MIVDSMTIHEITESLISEKNYVVRCAERFVKQFKGVALKSNVFPCSKAYKCTTPNSKIPFSIILAADKRGNYTSPTGTYFAVYSRPEGAYAAMLEDNWTAVTIFPPHFFKRYRERVVKDNQMSNEKLINRFFTNFWGYCDMWVDENQKQVFEKEESPDEQVNMVGAYKEGLIFGFNEGKVNLAKTIVPLDMLFEDQLPLFKTLLDELDKQMGQRFGSIYRNSLHRL